MKFRTLLFLLVYLYSGLCWSVCAPHTFTAPGQVDIRSDAVMVVVHASSTYDARFASKRGIDEAVAFAKGAGIPVIYLQDDSPGKFYFMEDCEPTWWVQSQGGEVAFQVPARHLYIVGGHLEICLSLALHDIIFQWSRQPAASRTVTFFMDAIYSNGKAVDPADPFYGDFTRFLSVVSYGRPGGEHWPKVSLLETMGVILRQDQQLAYLRQILPRWDTTFPENYRVELQLNDAPPKLLRQAPEWQPPRILFRFVDSAINLTLP